jgi:FkbM family methyltransferase
MIPIQADEHNAECARAHEEAVITKDEYKIAELFANDPNIEYIVDIGGNLGCASVQFQKFYPNAKIILCEPEPNLMKWAKVNTENKLIYAEKAIVGDPEMKEAKFNVCHWGGNHHVDGHFRWDLFEPMGSRKIGEITVEATTLKQLMDDNNFPRIDLLKIDCEGLEGEILQNFKPYMSLVNHFRGEWHGDADIPLIEDALKDTHDVSFEHTFTTHGGIFADRKI